MRKPFVLLLAVPFISFNAVAAPRTAGEICAVALKAIHGTKQGQSAPRQGELKELHKSSGITVMGYENGGFAVIANDDIMPEVLGVSDAVFSGTANPGFQWWLKAINEVCETNTMNRVAAANVPTPTFLGFEPRVDPIVLAEWDQDTPYWNMCPRNRSNQRCLTGCVATAIAQVLYTHRTPIEGSGQRTNYKSYSSSQNPNGSYEDITFVYEGWTPDYDNMIDCYTSGSHANQYTTEQVNAVADLMLACGVAVNMDYGSDGSGAYTDQAAEGLIQYMGITTADFKERDYYSDTEWMTMVYEELEGGHAMYYSAVDSNPWTGGGHAFVCDGYDETGKVHINWGWSGKDNGFFNINLLNPGSYEFSKYQDFIRGLWDPNGNTGGIEYVTLKLENVTPGSLAETIGPDNYVALRSLTVSGELNDDDLSLLRQLAMGTELIEVFGIEGKGHLSMLDLSDAVLPDNAIADNAFQDCATLTSVKLPRQLERIGSNAFSGCSRLSRIQSYTFAVPKMGTRVFEGVRGTSMSLYFIAGSSEYYRRNAQWKVIANENNCYEFGTSLKAKNATREYGAANPVFGYQFYGNRVVGSPQLWCDANETTEPGKYVIHIEAGSITDLQDVVFVDGTLTITGEASAIEEVGASASPSVEYSLGGVRLNGQPKNTIRVKNGKIGF